MKKFGILFVCTGNICRSPTAEAVFRRRVAALGLEARFHTDSAGIHDYHAGDAPDPRTRKAARARGIMMDDLVARRVRADDFERFDLIVAMDRGHERALQALKPKDGGADVALFLKDRDVPDPYYGDAAGFEHVLDLVESGVEALLADLQQRTS